MIDASVHAIPLTNANHPLAQWSGQVILLADANAEMYFLVLITNISIQMIVCASARKFLATEDISKINSHVTAFRC